MTNPVVQPLTELDAQRNPTGRTSYWLFCPGCQESHRIDSSWSFDGNLDRPTFEPSILVQYGSQPDSRRCHSFLRGGVWQFLSDSTHALAGQNVPAVPLPDWLARRVVPSADDAEAPPA